MTTPEMTNSSTYADFRQFWTRQAEAPGTSWGNVVGMIAGTLMLHPPKIARTLLVDVSKQVQDDAAKELLLNQTLTALTTLITYHELNLGRLWFTADDAAEATDWVNQYSGLESVYQITAAPRHDGTSLVDVFIVMKKDNAASDLGMEPGDFDWLDEPDGLDWVLWNF